MMTQRDFRFSVTVYPAHGGREVNGPNHGSITASEADEHNARRSLLSYLHCQGLFAEHVELVSVGKEG